MKPNDMHRLARSGAHACAPKGYRGVPNCTGDTDLDATIMHRSNRDMPKRLALYVKTPGNAYGYRTNYSGYHGNHGDD